MTVQANTMWHTYVDLYQKVTAEVVRDDDFTKTYRYNDQLYYIHLTFNHLTIITPGTKTPDAMIVCAFMHHYAKDRAFLNSNIITADFHQGTVQPPEIIMMDDPEKPSKNAKRGRAIKKLALVAGCVVAGMAVKAGVAYAFSR